LSLIECCKLVEVEPFAYLKDAPERINAHHVDRSAELPPCNWVPKVSATAAAA